MFSNPFQIIAPPAASGGGGGGGDAVTLHGASVPIAGALTIGNVLQVSGAAALVYAALNLAGGANYVTGVLPKANQGAQDMVGDVTGNTGASVVAKVNGATVPAAGALTTGNGLYVSGASALSYSALNLAGGANYVTGVLPKANQGAQDMVGDVTGNTGASVVATLTGSSNLVTVPATTSVQFGTNPAGAGTLRFAHGGSAQGRDNANTNNRVLWSWGVVANDTAAFGDVNVAAQINATTLTINNATAIIHGTTPSTTGDFRVRHGYTVSGRNSSNTGDFILWSFGVVSNNQLQLSAAGIPIILATANLQFTTATAAPTLDHAAKAGSGVAFTIRAQGSSSANGNGGALILMGGALNGSGTSGGVQIARNGVVTATAIELTELVVGRRVLALNRGAVLTTTQMPANTGDLVIFMGDCATAPTASPVSGIIEYSNSGKWGVRSSGGGQFESDFSTSATATNGGGELVKANVEGYIVATIGGTARKIPYYQT